MLKDQRDIESAASRLEQPEYATKSRTDDYRVLLADDSADDRFLMRLALDRVPRLKIVAEVTNGSEVIAYFNGLGRNPASAPAIPDLLLLDLKMPFKDGFEVLEWLRPRKYKNLNIVVLTDSVDPHDIKRALDLGADNYQIKSRTNDERHAMAVAFEEYLMNLPANHFPASAPSLACR